MKILKVATMAMVVLVGILVSPAISEAGSQTHQSGPVILRVDSGVTEQIDLSQVDQLLETARTISSTDASSMLWMAGLLPGGLSHADTRTKILAAAAHDIDLLDQRAPSDISSYTALVSSGGIKLVPSVDISSSERDAPQLKGIHGYAISVSDLQEIGQPIYKRSGCYRKASWSEFRHDICYWKYRIDDFSGNYDYWLYGNELTATSTKSHWAAGDPWIGWSKAAQQLGWSYRRDYTPYNDTVKAHAPRGTQSTSSCSTTTFSTSVSAKSGNNTGTVGISHPLTYCNRITEYMNFGNTYKRATYVWNGGWSGQQNKRKTSQVTTQTILKLKQRPYNSWQPYWSDTAQTRMESWNDRGIYFTGKTFG